MSSEEEEISKYVVGKEKYIADMKKDYGNLKWFGARWDSKVPEEEKSKKNFISFASTKCSDITDQIAIYETFFSEVKKIVLEKSSEKPADKNSKFKLQKMNALKEKMTKQLQSAKQAQQSTASSAIYNLHHTFIQEYDKLKSIVVDSQNEALIQAYDEMEKRWKEATKTLEASQKDLKRITQKCDEMNRKLDNLEKIEKTNDDLNKKLEKMEKDKDEMNEKLDKIMNLLVKPPPGN